MKKTTKARLGVHIYYVLLALGELIIAGGVALLLSLLLRKLEVQLSPVLWVLVFSIILSCVLGGFLSALFFTPIARLSRAMRQVQGGDFSIRMENPTYIREVRDLYENFNLMTRELEATEIIQSDFVSNVSHEFKTPINAIEGYAMLLQDGQRSEEQALYVKKIMLNTRRLSELVGNVLLLSKVDHQAIDGNTSRFRLDEQIRSALLLLESKWTERETEFDVELESIEFTGNESMLLHVWSNLIDNAIKYGPRGGLITLRLREEAGQAVFTIEDCGPGIPESHQPHIFDKFYQVESSRTTEGNGLGLALTKRVLDVCGGTIAVENLPTAGCRFTVKLPLNG